MLAPAFSLLCLRIAATIRGHQWPSGQGTGRRDDAADFLSAERHHLLEPTLECDDDGVLAKV